MAFFWCIMYYYRMNDHGQYLSNSNHWTNYWCEANLTLTIPDLNINLYGKHDIYWIDEQNLAMNPGCEPSEHELAQLPKVYIIIAADKKHYLTTMSTWQPFSKFNRENAYMAFQQETATAWIKSQRLSGCEIQALDRRAFMLNDLKLDVDFAAKYGLDAKKIDSVLDEITKEVDPKKLEEFLAASRKLAKKFKKVEFKPHAFYNEGGDQFEIYITDKPSFCDPIGPQAPGLMVMREFESKEITGFKLQGVMSRLSDRDPSRKAYILDLDLVTMIVATYRAANITKVTKEEMEFFIWAYKHWPGLSPTFIQSLTLKSES